VGNKSNKEKTDTEDFGDWRLIPPEFDDIFSGSDPENNLIFKGLTTEIDDLPHYRAVSEELRQEETMSLFESAATNPQNFNLGYP
jgi:hypothetical protein